MTPISKGNLGNHEIPKRISARSGIGIFNGSWIVLLGLEAFIHTRIWEKDSFSDDKLRFQSFCRCGMSEISR